MNKNDPTKEISISAIGRTLSEANAARVRQIHNLAGNILDEAGLIETSFAQRVEADAALIAAQERGFANSLARSMWHNTMMEAAHRVEQQFHHFCAHRDKSGLDLLLKEFTEVVRGLYDQSISLNIYPPIPDGERAVFASEEESGETEPTTEEPEPEPEPEEHSPKEGEIQLMCGVQSLPVVIEASGANYHPVRGVLFRIDEPSEAPPSVGTGKPLYVPRKVAEALLGKVNNLPLDADDSLSRHANEKIVGVMVKASIEGNDFIVEGHLWPWNNRAKVSLISANSRDLGMSMNAYAKGRNETVDGTSVFWIDELELLGANILFHEKATYKKTRFAAEATPEQTGETVAIAASSDEVLDDENFEDNEDNDETHEAIEAEADNSEKLYDSQTEEMDNHNIQLQLEAISRLLTDTVGKIGDEMAEIKAEMRDTESRVNVLLEEKTAEAQRIAASQQEETEKSKQQAMIDSITQAVISAINPSRQPQRITSTPIAAAGGAKAPNADALPRDVVELLCERSKLDAQIQASENDLGAQLALVDRKRDLTVQLSQLGYAG